MAKYHGGSEYCQKRNEMVGNGQSIQIWMDKGTLNSSTYKIVSPPAGLPLEARVCELIEQTLGTWKADLIQSC